MSKREPTIEQNSHFSAKTKDGQDVEFDATLRFYVSPSGQVTLSVPGGRQATEPSTGGPPAQQSPPNTERSKEIPRDPDAGRREVYQPQSESRVQEKRAMRDSSIDRAFPPGPEQSAECAIKEFIPDPCKAVDDAVKSIKRLYNGFFSGPKCPPPTNTDNLNVEYMPLYKYSENDYSEKPEEVVDSKDNENKEMMENEQKYDM